MTAKVIPFRLKHIHKEGEPCNCETLQLKIEGFDDCIVGTAMRPGMEEAVFCYDVDRIIANLVGWHGVSEEEALKWIDTNMIGNWVGDGTPIFFFKKRGFEFVDSEDKSNNKAKEDS